MIQTTHPISGHNINRLWYSLCFMLLALASCKKEINGKLSGNTEDIAFNFYAASDVMQTAYSPKRAVVAAYVDAYQEQTEALATNAGSKFPLFAFGYVGGTEYPSTNRGSNDGSINYVRYNTGSHRLFYTDINNTVVLDTTISVTGFNGLYLADAMTIPGAPAKYKLVVAPEDRKPVEGKTGVRFIHLSADAGNLICNLQQANGNLTGAQAGELTFGQVSDYQYYGADETTSDGLVRFTLSNIDNGIKFNAGVPFDPGRNYVIVISGFRTEQQRQVATGKNPDGSIKKETITIGSGLRTQIRRSY